MNPTASQPFLPFTNAGPLVLDLTLVECSIQWGASSNVAPPPTTSNCQQLVADGHEHV